MTEGTESDYYLGFEDGELPGNDKIVFTSRDTIERARSCWGAIEGLYRKGISFVMKLTDGSQHYYAPKHNKYGDTIWDPNLVGTDKGNAIHPQDIEEIMLVDDKSKL